MLLSSKDYFRRLMQISDSDLVGTKVSKPFVDACLEEVVKSTNQHPGMIKLMHEVEPIVTVDFYLMLLNKLHKITTELLQDNPKPLSACVKTATSIITQSTITLEKQFNEKSIESANEFIECIGLDKLSLALYKFFSANNSSLLEFELDRIKNDMLFVKSNFAEHKSNIDEVKN